MKATITLDKEEITRIIRAHLLAKNETIKSVERANFNIHTDNYGSATFVDVDVIIEI